ncbi:YfhO family protein [Aureitalea marina]|uniref:Membrane protein YfhO n=1 Tax=Aureitalea marina TaxID=930804 RepID=A0A2S7KPJ1_9FLAO|nr:YfhO family protein [Aureitalea marina]PQB04498.1 hypothetical protein BST85_05985 [Aureitalea marina]
MQNLIRGLWPHLLVLVVFVLASLIYFNPVLQGKTIFQSDIVQYIGMAKEQNDFREATGDETYWTNSAFAGMPTYQLGAKYPHNYIKKLDLLFRFLPRPADYLFLYFVGFYILMRVLKVKMPLAALGALAFGFSTYLIIILGVGHNAKAHAIAYMPLVLSGVLLCFRGRLMWGFLLTTIALALELVANHFQMTYYLGLLLVCVGVAYFIQATKEKQLKPYFKSVGVLLGAAILAAGLNSTNLMATKEYADTSTRGKSELTINPDGSTKQSTSGLDYDYITEYSYGIAESLNLYISRFMGGGSAEEAPKKSKAFDELLAMGASPSDARQIVGQVPMYWGDQTYVAAPAYVGAVVVFLALLSLFLVKGPMRWWLVSGFLLSLLLSWGKNFPILTDFFISYVPLYNKFRAVSSIQVILELVLPIMGTLGLMKMFSEEIATELKRKALIRSSAILGGLTALFYLTGGSLFSFSSPYDEFFIERIGLPFVDAVREDRLSLMKTDALRSLVLMLAVAALLWFFLKEKVREPVLIGGLTLLLLIDLIGVDRRYINEDDFVAARVMKEPFQQNGANMQILEDDQDYYRVLDNVNDPWNSAQASYYHHSIGGYHAAKPGRMQDIYEFYITEGNVGVLNMLNVRYIIAQNQNGGAVAQRNPFANGNAWLVDRVELVDNADQEILALDSLNTKTTAVVRKEHNELLPGVKGLHDSLSTIELTAYRPDHMVYDFKAQKDQLAVFSDTYYEKGWNAYIDGELTPHFRANYLLRALAIPAGEHQIEFRFEPVVIKRGGMISLGSSVLFVLLFAWSVYRWKKEESANPTP